MILEKISNRVFGNKKYLLIIALANLAGFFTGIYYYWGQLMDSSPILWIIIIDSPLSVLLFSVVCFLYIFGKRIPEFLKFLTAVYVIKYGIWTMITLCLYWSNYLILSDQIIGIANFFLHFGMVLEGVVFIPKIKVDRINALLVTLLVIGNDFMDYVVGTVTRIPPTHVGILMIESFAATIVITILIIFYQNKLS
ncbi:MAG: DUF1405 domain-containing protein [Candidatus Aenigmarchaeota archaeon]|nr:DUF1405 domain-containing protein [Candidatus Aenigmarchaeota archaeon]